MIVMPNENCRQRWYENSSRKRLGLRSAWVALVAIVLGGAIAVGQNMIRVDHVEDDISEMQQVLKEVVKQSAVMAANQAATATNQKWATRAFKRLERQISRIEAIRMAPPLKPWEKYRGETNR